MIVVDIVKRSPMTEKLERIGSMVMEELPRKGDRLEAWSIETNLVVTYVVKHRTFQCQINGAGWTSPSVTVEVEQKTVENIAEVRARSPE